MLKVSQVGVSIGGRRLFSELDFQLSPGQRIGILGRNGCGKSSLLKVLRQELDADQGDVSIPPDWKLSSVSQESPQGRQTAVQTVLAGHHELQAAIDRLNQNPEDPIAHQAMENLDGYSAEARAAELLHALGFSSERISHEVDALSGGWRSRLALAQALFRPWDLLLLDEPTNHLDLVTIDWLGKWLAKRQPAVLCVSHDREFLDSFATHILWFENQGATLYAGNLSVAEEKRAFHLSAQSQLAEKQKKRASELERFVNRFRAKASKAKQAQSRLKMLERLTASAPVLESQGWRLSFPQPERVCTPLLSIQDGSAGYNGTPILSNIGLSILPGDRIGLLGANGAGKSTLMKFIAGLLDGPGRTAGDHLKIGYYAQHQLDQLDYQDSPFDHIRKLMPDAGDQEIRDHLGAFGFHGDSVFDPLEYRSGGEKARLALASLTAERPNLLILDEPTNHLDLEARQTLAAALQQYQGAVIFVSHDRMLLDACSDQFYLVDNGTVRRFDDDLNDYIELIQKPAGTSAASVQARKNRRQQRAAERERLRPLTRQVKQLEKQLTELNATVDQINQQLTDSALYQAEQKEQLLKLQKQAAEAKAKIPEIEDRWLELSSELEAISS